MSEFSDRPLVADSITGIRSFRVDSLGRLTGVSHQHVWRPGVNESECRKGPTWSTVLGGSIKWHLTAFGGYSGTVSEDKTKPVEVAPDEPKEHQVASLDCACGFYAYTDREANPYHREGYGSVLGVVRGSGVATVGSRGFRAQRAEIVALVDPVRSVSRWDLFCLWAARFGPVGGGLGGGLGLAGVVATIGAFGSGAWLAGVGAALVALFFVAFTIASFCGIGMSYDRPDGVDFAAVRRAYPHVPVFRSADAAVAAFPLSTPPTPTPDDEDFWTRSAS